MNKNDQIEQVNRYKRSQSYGIFFDEQKEDLYFRKKYKILLHFSSLYSIRYKTRFIVEILERELSLYPILYLDFR
jgi:hypothetical protein